MFNFYLEFVLSTYNFENRIFSCSLALYHINLILLSSPIPRDIIDIATHTFFMV